MIHLPQPRVPYVEICKRLQGLSRGKLQKMGSVDGYPLHAWIHSPSRSRARAILSSGCHGDEPAGVLATLELLEEFPAWLRPYSLTVFPCLNPWGYEHHRRTNARGEDINRQWRHDCCKEVRLAKRLIRNQDYDLFISLHEDYDGTGFYLYEISRNGNSWGESIIQKTGKIIPIEKRKRVENRSHHKGVITRSSLSVQRRKNWPEAIYHILNQSQHTLTLETPTHFALSTRILAHKKAVQAALGSLDRKVRAD